MISIPATLSESTLRREGAAGRRWLRDLPGLIARFLDEWGCEVVGPAWNGEVAIVVPVRRADEPAVLKISFPHASFDGEVGALRHFRGRGAVRVLRADEPDCAVLLERAGPGTLASVPSADEAIEIAGGLARRLAVPAPEDAHSLARATEPWADQLERQLRELPGALSPAATDRALAIIELLGSDDTSTVMHGDLHAGNVLAAVREPWLTIDPVGWRGTAAFDAFTVVAGRREDQSAATDPDVIRARIRRYARAADVEPDLAEACCQARATSAYLHQRLHQGAWFDPDFLRAISMLGVPR